ncbi:hypothetical protein [Photobacterium sp. GB-56]|uniref:hypothetical protein n=1 Tax=Photobacterium sp. GB-56 TaxID=2022106 RepID=UPI000D184ADE|nr:hypothetical protein [Photobacterium sp. GB-56]PSV26864.1 hypothetical protein C9J42_08325 [Photobacterium sp. GB-56]
MNKYLPFIGLTLLISGCATQTVPQSEPQVITKIVKQNTAPVEKKGYDDGCKNAMEAQFLPSKEIVNSYDTVNRAAYLKGWEKGYKQCVIGLGPVRINSSMPAGQTK